MKELKQINERLCKIVKKLIDNSEAEEPVEKLIRELSMAGTPIQTILESDHKIATNILPKLYHDAHSERIEKSRLEAMFGLHHRDQVTTKLTEQV